MHHFWETRRSDHTLMMGHHLITLGLVSGSYYFNFLPVGCMVLLCHDCNDIFMEIAKLCKYSGAETIGTVIFAMFTLLWCTTRLYIYPFSVIRSCFVHLNPFARTLPLPYLAGAYALEGLLCSLVVLHIYWTYLILKIWYDGLRGELRDNRE